MNLLSSAALSVLYVVVTVGALLLGLSLLVLCALVAGCAAVAGWMRGRLRGPAPARGRRDQPRTAGRAVQLARRSSA